MRLEKGFFGDAVLADGHGCCGWMDRDLFRQNRQRFRRHVFKFGGHGGTTSGQFSQRCAVIISSAQVSIGSVSNTMVAPTEMAGLLEGLLGRHPGIRLLALRSSAPETVPLGADASGAPATPPAVQTIAAKGTTGTSGSPGLYRHGIELQLEGSWSDLHAYLKAIEKLPKQVLWSRIELRVERHPTVTMKLTLHTMSMERAWIAL